MNPIGAEHPDFLSQEPTPVESQAHQPVDYRLPDAVVEQLMSIPGVDGVWIEYGEDHKPEVVLHITNAKALSSLPTVIQGLVVRPRVVGEPIKAYPAR
jgi:hypothetical protein